MVFIGTSGWSYAHWRDVFYPSELKSRDYLAYYCDHFSTVEVNSTFYHLPQAKTMQNWAEKTPSDFSFAIKGSRYISHRLKLRDCRSLLSPQRAIGCSLTGVTVQVHRVQPGSRNLWIASRLSASTM